MASKGVRAIHYQVTPKFEAGYCASHTNETLIGYTEKSIGEERATLQTFSKENRA